MSHNFEQTKLLPNKHFYPICAMERKADDCVLDGSHMLVSSDNVQATGKKACRPSQQLPEVLADLLMERIRHTTYPKHSSISSPASHINTCVVVERIADKHFFVHFPTVVFPTYCLPIMKRCRGGCSTHHTRRNRPPLVHF